MVKTNSENAGTMRATSTMSDSAQTMIEHNSTMLESDLGTMVINSDDDEDDDGTMKSMLNFSVKTCRNSCCAMYQLLSIKIHDILQENARLNTIGRKVVCIDIIWIPVVVLMNFNGLLKLCSYFFWYQLSVGFTC